MGERLEQLRAELERLEAERAAFDAEAEQHIAGMREVKLFGAANAQGCIGGLARPLLAEADDVLTRLSSTTTEVERLRGALEWIGAADCEMDKTAEGGCEQVFPDEPESWCPPCFALAALDDPATLSPSTNDMEARDG